MRAYDAVGNVTRVTKAGRATIFAYDALNRTVAITDALGHATWLGYDALGNVTQRTDPTGVLVQYGYDAASQLQDVTGPLGLLAQYAYDAAGNLETLTDANGHATHYGYDELNRLASVLDALDGLTEYTYDPVGNLETVSDARRHVTHYAYDELDRLLTVTGPLDHVTAYGYDPVGNTTVITDADGGVTALSYDALDRLLRVDYPDSAVEYAYDPVGNRLAMTDTTGVTTYDYDDLYRPLTITAPYAGPVGYRYDALSRRTATLYPGGESVAYTYDDASRLTQVADWASGVTTYTYDDAGRVLGALLPNGVETGYEYDTAGRLTGIQHEHGSDWQTRYEYGLDAAGNRVAVTETTTAVHTYGLPALGRSEAGADAAPSSPGGWPVWQRIAYSYDDADRLTDAQYDSGDRYEYAYDAVGNRTALTVTAQAVDHTSTSYAYDDADRLTSVDGVGHTYDNRGNLTSNGAWAYTYNAAGRMVHAESITTTMVYTYNGDGLLVAEARDGVETRFTWDQALGLPQVLATSDGERDLYGLERIGVTLLDAWYYPQSDALGSVRQWADPAGAVLGLQAYGPYGEAMTSLGPPPTAWGYAGEWEDASRLVYLRARWYNGALGRFTQADSAAPVVDDPRSLNRFAYAANNPQRFRDPSGRWPDPRDVAWWIVGFGHQWLYENLWFLTPQQKQAYGFQAGEPAAKTAGREAGAQAAQITGAAEIIVGGAGMLGGSIGCETGVGALVAVGGAALAYHGVGTAVVSSADLLAITLGRYLSVAKGSDSDNPSSRGRVGDWDRPPDDPTQSPGQGWKWEGSGDPETGKGSWVNRATGESLHPHLGPSSHGPHWDYVDPIKRRFRWFLDGRMELK